MPIILTAFTEVRHVLSTVCGPQGVPEGELATAWGHFFWLLAGMYVLGTIIFQVRTLLTHVMDFSVSPTYTSTSTSTPPAGGAW
jgi:hypothetical protein